MADVVAGMRKELHSCLMKNKRIWNFVGRVNKGCTSRIKIVAISAKLEQQLVGTDLPCRNGAYSILAERLSLNSL